MRRYLFVFILIFVSLNAAAFTLQPGDLLFQDLNCGALCNAITTVTEGYDHTDVSHIAMVVNTGKHPMVIEAIGKDVHETPLHQFLLRSLDKQGQPRVMVGRLTPPYRHLIPRAIQYAEAKLADPYNSDFTPANKGRTFYCSQLIYDAFQAANDNHPIFKQDRMNFKNPSTGVYVPAWQQYFTQLHQPIPQGKWGTNPGALSRMPDVEIIYFYGKLRHNVLSST